jgi:hypothetical protein
MEALRYFNSASLRNETVFLSYAGDDRDVAARMTVALKARFQSVFDYRDQGESIIPGRRWIDEVFDKLAASAIGIPLLSASYFASGNCAHEAREMVSLSDQGKLSLVPVKLNAGALELPTWMRDLQYLRGWEYEDPLALVRRIESAYDAPATPANR